MKNKKIFFLCILVILALLFALYLIKTKTAKRNYVIGTAIATEEIIDKNIVNDNFYLTLVLDNAVVEEYNLSYKTATFRTTKSVYDKVSINDSTVGVSVNITIPCNETIRDVGMVLKSKKLDYIEIYSLTLDGNILIS